MFYYLMLVIQLFAQDPSGGTGQTQPSGIFGGGLGGFLPIIIMFLILYLLLIRPQAKQRKQIEEMRQSLKKNDKIITAGGIIGTIISINNDTITIRTRDVKLDVQRTAISAKLEG